MQKWKVYYYTTAGNECELTKYLDKLSEKNRQKVLAWITVLEEQGPTLPRPFADLLEDGIHELRIKLSGRQERILYFFIFQNYIILTHAFTKKSSAVPKSEIEKAKNSRIDFAKRFRTINDFEKQATH
jgi:phage-related protein